MADNFDFTEGSGKTGAADEVGGVLYARVKLDLGTDGAAAPALAGAGAVATGVQRITLASDDPAVAKLGTIDTDTGVIAGDTTSIDGKITACNTGAVVLAAGTASIGKLAANTGVDIGDVDILSIAAGDNNIGNVDIVTVPAPLNIVGGGAEATALRVTLANDSTGVITVDGTVTANLSATDNAVLDAIDTVLDTINTKLVTGTVIGDVNLGATDNAVLDAIDTVLDTINTKLVTGTVIGDVNLGATDNAVLDAIAASLVTIDSDTNDIKTATEIMDDWDATHASAAPADGVQVMGAAYSTALPTDVGADADAARICTDRFGRVLAGLMPQNFQATFTSADAQAATPVKAKTASRKMYILSLTVSVDTAMNVQFQDDTGPTVLIEGMYFAANGGAHLTWPPEAPLVVNTNEDFDVITSAAGNISVTITGYLAV